MPEFDLTRFVETVNRVRQKAIEEGRLTDNPPGELLRRLVAKQPRVRKTMYGNFVAESEPTSRSAMFTKNSIDHSFGQSEEALLAQCEAVLAKEKLISIDRVVGNVDSSTTVRLIVPEHFAHIAYGGGNLFVPVRKKVKEPTYQILFFADDAFTTNHAKPLPEKDITIRLAMLADGRYVKIIRNGNYIGEYKKGVFAAEDWVAKTRKGGIFLHAGCREDYLQSVHGDYQTVRTLLIALSANGKTTTTSRILATKGKERSWMVQDDGGTLMPDGSFHGFEAGGVFVKTEGVNPGEQPEIYYGLLKPETVCENVYVTEDGDFDFYNLQRTSNGRAVIVRRDFMHASPYIEVDRIDNLILITRGPLIPAISKLTPEQAAALMVLGQAMESSAGDPTQAGTIRSEFFYDPFVSGDLAEHANSFYKIIKGLPHLNFYLLNTGGIGEGERYRDIRLEFTMGILDSLIRGGLEDWADSPTGFQVPAAIRVVDDVYVHPEKIYSSSEFEEKQSELDKIRYQAVAELGSNLNAGIRSGFNKA
ncbi:MAG: phosphoenolpyruvate carboxykinase (ATP) [Chloroflexi bacterium]|nr:phosphoenolpyruvate carboxykinase (ATP) [Chloroflexota bacterium]MBI3040742.1 phosphoenolpyruvate carboxykinase (ATP) [Chloroflexota bacterium]